MSSSTLRPTPERAAELKQALEEVNTRVRNASSSRPSWLDGRPEPRLVAVSKLKPAEDIQACYEQGHRDFGENYAGELAEKAEVTVDTSKKALTLNKSLPPGRTEPLNVYIQVNTSGEDTKSGIAPLTESSASSPSELVDLARLIIRECPRLRLLGLMTIGSFEASTEAGNDNPDFRSLVESKQVLEGLLKADSSLIEPWGMDGQLELSMGMSADFEQAIRAGSGSVRVGTSIFGTRPPKSTGA
ncbi:hypothetical protein FRB99_007699 [Tulasnella sp. 403]|nr:hypothetical protein FRB99_007699 [Tulasnella sp. 403]